MPPAPIFLSNHSNIHLPLASERAAKPSIRKFNQQKRRLHGFDSLAFINQIFRIRPFRTRFLKIFSQKVLRRNLLLLIQFQMVQHPNQQTQTSRSKTLIHHPVDLIRPGACLNQFRSGAENAAVCISKTKPSGIRGKGHKKRFGYRRRNRPAGCSE